MPQCDATFQFHSRGRVPIWGIAVYLGLSIWSTWPLARSLTTDLPLGTEQVATVPLFNAWTIWWNADRAAVGFRDYWDAPIFHPTDRTFAFSEPQPTSVLVAPAVWTCGTPVPAYNLYLLLNLTLNGWFAARLLARVYGRAWPALLGGAMVVLLPFVHWQLGVLQLVPLWGVLWTISALWTFSETPHAWTALSAGAGFAVTYLMCNHYGLFLSVLLVPSSVFLLGRRLWKWRDWLRLLPGIALGAALLAPVVVVQLQQSREHEWVRSRALVERLSLRAGDYTSPPWPDLLPAPDFAEPDRSAVGWNLSPGFLKVLLAAVGLIGGALLKRYRRWTAACATLLAVALLMSLGTNLRIGPATPFDWFVEWYPGFAQIRNIFRFAVFAQLVVALLAAGGLAILADVIAGPFGSWRATASLVLVAVLGGCAAFEIQPAEQDLYEVPSIERHRGWIGWVRKNTRENDVLACAPFPTGGSAWDYQPTTEWMYLQTAHGRPLVNGYSGFFPQQFLDLKKAMARFPDATSLELLRQRGVKFCIVDRVVWDDAAIERFRGLTLRLVLVYEDDEAEVDVFRLQ